MLWGQKTQNKNKQTNKKSSLRKNTDSDKLPSQKGGTTESKQEKNRILKTKYRMQNIR